MDISMPGITVDEFVSPDRLEYTSMLQVARHLIELRILEDKVLHEIHLRDQKATRGLIQADRRTIVLDLCTEIENWYSNGCLLKSREPDDLMIHIRMSWLAARYYNLLLLLYCPSRFDLTASLLSKGELVVLAQKHV
ncbi:Fc.00g036300.m01.CDS01 [Cosmosporella sp. VM-42]